VLALVSVFVFFFVCIFLVVVQFGCHSQCCNDVKPGYCRSQSTCI